MMESRKQLHKNSLANHIAWNKYNAEELELKDNRMFNLQDFS